MDVIPVIGISGSIKPDESQLYLPREYMAAVLATGGIPMLLSPDMDEDRLALCLSHLHGVLLTGGGDIAPRLYHAMPQQGLGEVSPLRDGFELPLVRACHERQIPVLGICRGIQVMNVALGGTLCQDLATQFLGPSESKTPMLHNQTSPGQYSSHSIHIDKGSNLFAIVHETMIHVNSFHHQAVERVAPSLQTSSMAPDGVVEAVEDAALPFFLGVQWHPERMYRTDEFAYALFLTFVRAAGAYAMNRNL